MTRMWTIRAWMAGAVVAAGVAVRAADGVHAEAAARAVEHMAAAWPGRYAATTHRAAVEAFRTREPALREAAARGDAAAGAEAERLEAGVRAALLANPLLDFDRLLVLKRGFPKPADARSAMGASLGVGTLNAHTSDTLPRRGHWNDELAVLSNLRGGGTFSTVYRPAGGETVIDPDLDFDGARILFAQEGAQRNWRVFEVRADGTGLRQVTPDDGADVGHFDPCWLPDGGAIFASTAVYQGLPCEFGGRIMVCLYRRDAATGAIRQLTFEQDSDWCPTMMADGRVLYQRWEYSDLPHSNSRRLFTMNPDGTVQRAFYGSNGYFPNSFFHARPVPGHARRVIGVAGGHHGTPRSGRLLILDASLGQREAEGVVQEIPGFGRKVEPIIRDRLVDGVWPQFLMPYPLSDTYHLVAAKLAPDALWGIYLVDTFDNMTRICEVEGGALLEPIPLRPTPRPPAIADRAEPSGATATVLLTDIHRGPGLAGIPRGAVKALRVVEYYFSYRGTGGLLGSIGMDGPWDIKRILGTVPVEADGSAFFTIPANTPLMVQPLDAQGQALQLMRSWFVGMPGEPVSCVGCHETADEAAAAAPSMAMRRAPSSIAPWHGPARGFNFAREVQPVLDRHCVCCHGDPALAAAAERAGPGDRRKPYLKGDVAITNWSSQIAGNAGTRGGGRFSLAYAELHRFVRRPGIEGDMRLLSPMDYHFSTTELGQILRRGHFGVALDAEDWERLAAWADLNAPFHGTWGEIVGTDQVAGVAARARELRKLYVPGGPFPDYEAVPEAAVPAGPGKPGLTASAVASDRAQAPAVAGWPFDAAEAARRQAATAPQGTKGRLTIPLDPPSAGRPAPRARFLRVEAGPTRWLSIAEAEVFAGGRNVARGRTARQSSTSHGGDAGRAVDGDRNGVYDAGSITHTGNAEGEWWEVDLGAEMPVETVALWNRTDCAGERLGGCGVVLLDAARQETWRAKTGDSPGAVIDLRLADPREAVELAWIPPGAFVAGGDGVPDSAASSSASVPKGFWMARCEISNAQFRRFDPAHDSRDESRHGYQFGRRGYDMNAGEQPAVRVSMQEAEAFCRWLSEKTGRRVRLPAEAEWEWACRAGAATPFSFGALDTDYAPHANLGDIRLREFAACTARGGYSAAEPITNPSRYDDWVPRDDRINDGGFVTESVGRRAPNAWGLHDMHGNAAEWTVPDGPFAVAVARGGSWYDRPFRCTAASRVAYAPHQRVFNTGFRVVVEN